MYKLCKTEQSANRQRALEQGLLQAMLTCQYDEISVSDLCAQLNIPRKAFYRYFDGKEGALHALIDHTLMSYEFFPAAYMEGEKRTLERDLEQFFGLSHPTVSGLLNRMEAKGFLEHRSDEKDRRIKRIYPTEKCLACSRSIGLCIRDNEERIFRGFTEGEREQFESLLQRATDNLYEKLHQTQQEGKENL